ncbi:MAG TPA: hypothetical protein VFC46_12305 [Humisphaera sp.]|nr:hypothetical protein [Humisphaera sp.]
MNHRLSRNEFVILSHLHDKALSFNADGALDLSDVATATGLSISEATKAASYLSSIGLTGDARPKMMTLAAARTRLIYLEGNGERFMRELEEEHLQQWLEQTNEQPGTIRTITVAVASIVYDIGKATIAQTLANFATSPR